MAAAVRRQAVEVLSARSEMLLVMRVGMAIVVGVWMYVALTAGSAVATRGPRNLLPFQRMVADRPFDEQRMFGGQLGVLAFSGSLVFAAFAFLGSKPRPLSLCGHRHDAAAFRRLRAGL